MSSFKILSIPIRSKTSIAAPRVTAPKILGVPASSLSGKRFETKYFSGNYPFKRDILRKAFVQSNPKVFRRSNPNWMYANKTMRIPGVDDIKRVIFKDQPDNKPSGKDLYEGWVRYP